MFFIKKLSIHEKNQNVIIGRLEAKRNITNDGQYSLVSQYCLFVWDLLLLLTHT